MSSLPFEILAPIFHDLEKKDLLQCQLICKQWHTASLPLLYSDVELNTVEEALLYIHTISDSPLLGKYLNVIFFGYIFWGSKFDKHGILKTVIQYCPNIVEIESLDQDPLFWTQLMNAGEQGQLSHLKILPFTESEYLEPYIRTALSFKDSLTTLHLSDVGPPYMYHLIGSAIFQTLCDEIDQFKNLQSLVFICSYDKYLSYFDGLIDRCSNLKELTYDVSVGKEEPSEPEKTVLPRPDIRMLECNWEQIKTESKLGYVICKFPSLQHLKVTTGYGATKCSSLIVVKLVQYALSIPDFELNIYAKKENLLNIWAEFINAKKGCKDVTVGYSRRHQSSSSYYLLDLRAVRGFDLVLPITPFNNEVPHIWFFLNVGKDIRSLIVNGPEKNDRIYDGASTILHWVFDILSLCPLIEEITVYNSQMPSLNPYSSKYHSVKKLTINGIEYIEQNNFLNNLSINVPNISQLFVQFNQTLPIDKNFLTIHMPRTSIDLLVWDEIKCKYFKEGGNFFIKLNTDTGLKFYEGNKYKLTSVDSSRYLSSSTFIRFDIHCKSLKRLEISKTNFNFTFE